MPILETLIGRANGVQHAGTSRIIKAKVQPIARRILADQRFQCVSLSTRKRKATCHDGAHATAAKRSLPATASEANSKEWNGLQTPRTPEPSQIEHSQPTGLTPGQGNGGGSGYGSGGDGGGGDGSGDGNNSSGDPEPELPLFLRFFGLLLRGPVVAILLSVVMYNWLQARHRRKQATDAAARDAEHPERAAPQATLFLGDDWPPLHANEQQDATAGLGFAAGHAGDETNRAGHDRRLAGMLPGTKDMLWTIREDIQRLKRLQQDAFEQMLRLDTRIELLEERSANGSEGSSSDVSALFGSTRGSVRPLDAAERAPIQASGQLVYSAAVPLHGSRQDSSRQQQHLSAGPELRLRLNSQDTDTGRSVKALGTADASQNGPRLQKLLYGGPAGEQLRFLVALLNGRGDDLAPTLHPQSGRGLTTLMRQGCPLHQTCQGSGVGAKFQAGGYYLTAAHLRGRLEGSTLLQVDCAPTAQLALGITGMQRGQRFAGHGAQTVTSACRDPADEEARPSLASAGSAAEHSQGSSAGSGRSLALTGAWRSSYDEYAISGWLALDQASEKQQHSWGATISSISGMDGQGWALSVGRVPFLTSAVDEEQLLAEAALHIRAGKGLLLTPSVICSHSAQGSNAVAALRTELSF